MCLQTSKRHAKEGRKRQGKARQGSKILSGKCCVARSCPRRPCRPLRLLPAACGMMSRRRRAPRRRSRRARAPAVLARTLASMATGFPVCRLGMEDRQSLGCFLKLLLLSEAGCACCPVRRSSSARVAARRPSGSGVLGVLKNLLPLKNPRQEPGRRGAVDSWWSAQRLACALRACGPRALPCLRAVSSTRARLARDGSLRQPALAQLSRARRDAAICPPHALRITACSLACSVLCAPSALSLMSVLAVSPRPRKGLLTLSSLLHQLSQVRADGPIRRARDDSVPRRCAWRSRCRRRRGRRR